MLLVGCWVEGLGSCSLSVMLLVGCWVGGLGSCSLSVMAEFVSMLCCVCVLRGREAGPGRLHLLQHAGGEGLCHGQRGLEHHPGLLRRHPHRE